MLIKTALAAARFSQREAARRAGISETRWRQIVSGHQAVGGEQVPFRSPDETLARMAHVVGVVPEQLEDAGRAGAAAELRDLEAGKRDADAAAALSAGSPSRLEERWWLLEVVLRRAFEGLNDSERAELARRVREFAAEAAEARAPGEAPAAGGRRRPGKTG